MYINLKMKSKNDIDNLKRKEYLNKFYETHCFAPNGKRILNVIEKFNNAIGFKKVIGYTDNKCIFHDAEVNSPENYKSPNEILLFGLNPCLVDNNILSVTVKKEIFEHTVKEYTYDTDTIMIKFKSFLEKIFPDLIIEMEYLDEIEKLSTPGFVLNEFFLGLDYEKVYTVEASVSRLLNKCEINHLLDTLKTITTLDISINQAYCKTCDEQSNGLTPIHIELIYNDLIELCK